MSSDEIFERLLLAIMEHRLPPGTQLVEARLAAIFKVSRTKVREAIGRLVHDCIATNIPNRGAFVSSPTITQAREVFAARRLIEPALVREVTRNVHAGTDRSVARPPGARRTRRSAAARSARSSRCRASSTFSSPTWRATASWRAHCVNWRHCRR